MQKIDKVRRKTAPKQGQADPEKNSNKKIQKVVDHKFLISGETKNYIFPRKTFVGLESDGSQNDDSYNSIADSSLNSLNGILVYNLNSQNWKNPPKPVQLPETPNFFATQTILSPEPPDNDLTHDILGIKKTNSEGKHQ